MGALAQCQSLEDLHNLKGQAAAYAHLLEWMIIVETKSQSESESE